MDNLYLNGSKNVESFAVLANKMVELSISMTKILIIAFNSYGIKNV